MAALLALGLLSARARAADPACLLPDTSTPVATCLRCHSFGHSHPADVDYENAAALSRGGLRPMAEVIRRGLFVPDGRVVCFTCHDANSRWGSRLVIPPGSRVAGRVDTRDPSTYESVPTPDQRMTVEQAARVLPEKTNLGPKPLCLGCHAFD